MDDDLLFVERVDLYQSLCVSTLARETIEETEIRNLGSDNGYFIYEMNDHPLSRGVSVLAKAASLEAAFRLIDLWRARLASSWEPLDASAT